MIAEARIESIGPSPVKNCEGDTQKREAEIIRFTAKTVFNANSSERETTIATMIKLGGIGRRNFSKPGMPPIYVEVAGSELFYFSEDEDGNRTLLFLQYHKGYDYKRGVRNDNGLQGVETKAVLQVSLRKRREPEDSIFEPDDMYIELKFLKDDALSRAFAQYDFRKRVKSEEQMTAD